MCVIRFSSLFNKISVFIKVNKRTAVLQFESFWKRGFITYTYLHDGTPAWLDITEVGVLFTNSTDMLYL